MMAKCLTQEEMASLSLRDQVYENTRNVILRLQEEMRSIANKKGSHASKLEAIKSRGREIASLRVCLRHLRPELDAEDQESLEGGYGGLPSDFGTGL